MNAKNILTAWACSAAVLVLLPGCSNKLDTPDLPGLPQTESNQDTRLGFDIK